MYSLNLKLNFKTTTIYLKTIIFIEINKKQNLCSIFYAKAITNDL